MRRRQQSQGVHRGALSSLNATNLTIRQSIDIRLAQPEALAKYSNRGSVPTIANSAVSDRLLSVGWINGDPECFDVEVNVVCRPMNVATVISNRETTAFLPRNSFKSRNVVEANFVLVKCAGEDH